MKIRLKDGCNKINITNGEEYVVYTDSTGRLFIYDNGMNIRYFSLRDFDVVPEVKESDIPSLEAMNQKSKVGTSKVIGYECPMDLFRGVIPKGTIYKKTDYGNNSYESDNAIQNMLPAEIVETWKPVYEEDIYVGGEKVELNIDKDFAYIHGIWITKEDLELLRDIPRETYDKIIQKLGVAENQES